MKDKEGDWEEGEVRTFQMRIGFGAELHDVEKGELHVGTVSHHRKGTQEGGRWPKVGHFTNEHIDTKVVPCPNNHGPLERCAICATEATS